MALINRLMRSGLALCLVGLISSQIPVQGTTALAQDSCPGPGGTGSSRIDTQDVLIIAAGIGAVYFIYRLATDGD